MRKYQPIWEQLKVNKQASLAADSVAHKRIIKAVVKEKYSDIAWKYTESEENRKWKLLYTIQGKLISFKLEDISEFIPLDLNDL